MPTRSARKSLKPHKMTNYNNSFGVLFPQLLPDPPPLSIQHKLGASHKPVVPIYSAYFETFRAPAGVFWKRAHLPLISGHSVASHTVTGSVSGQRLQLSFWVWRNQIRSSCTWKDKAEITDRNLCFTTPIGWNLHPHYGSEQHGRYDCTSALKSKGFCEHELMFHCG